MKVFAYGTQDASGTLTPVTFQREGVRPGEVAIQISHCGVCHSDLHQARNDWSNTKYPCVPGHEIVGTVSEVGEGVSRFAVGDRVGVGCMVNSCQECDRCEAGEEQYCTGPKGPTLTYNGAGGPKGPNTYGGYSDAIVVREEFVLRIPDALDMAEAAPILCAGITVYSPMVHFGLKAGDRLAVAGIGGLGHMAVQIGKALGAHVIALTGSEAKKDDILELGADEVIVLSDNNVDARDALKKARGTVDMLIDTIPYPHDMQLYLKLMATDGTIAMVGNRIEVPSFKPGPLVFRRVRLAGSLIGGVAQTQNVLDLCAEHGIAPEIRLIRPDQINEAWKRMEAEKVEFRHVIDMAAMEPSEDAPELPTPERGEVVG